MSPFSESRYREMLGGLEAMEVNLSDIVAESRGRMDAGYFAKAFVANSAALSGFPSVADLVDARARVNVKALRLEREFNYLEISGVELGRMDYVCSSVSPDEIPHRATRVLRNGDVVVSVVRPNRNAVALIRGARRLVATSGFAVLKARGISPEYLFAWCKTRPFITSLVRETTATMYPAVAVRDVLEARVFRPGEKIERQVQLFVRKAGQILDEAKEFYRQAEENLLRGIGLANWRPSVRAWTVKKFSRSFGLTGRLDAEYYSPKYDEITEALRRVGSAPLSALVDIHGSVEPGSNAYRESGIPFLRVADFSKFGFSVPAKFLDPDEYGEVLRELKPRKDSVLLTKDGTVGIAHRMSEDMDSITSGAILHLTAKSGAGILPDYLALALNSMPVQMQAERDMSGTVIAHWRPDEIHAVLIPLLPLEKQRVLAKLARESFRLRRESKRLLNAAVRAVECAMEKGEKAGLETLEKLAG